MLTLAATSSPRNAVMIFCMSVGYTTGSGGRKAGDDAGESLHVRLEGDVVGDAPPRAPCLESLDKLVHGSDEDIGAVEDVVRRELGPALGQLLRGPATVVGDDHA